MFVTNASYNKSYDIDTSISGPFNVQHNPKVKNIIPKSSVPPVPSPVSKRSAKSTSSQKSSLESDSAYTKNTIIVCVHSFDAEYENELSCKSGDVLKLVDPKITNGWVLAQSLTTGSKGWVPNDNIKILDLFEQKKSVSNMSNNDSDDSINTSKSADFVIDNSIFSNNENSNFTTQSKRSTAMTTSSSNFSGDNNSVLDYYSSLNPASSRPTLTNISDHVQTSTANSNLPFNSIFVHSMYSVEKNSSKFWYRIDLTYSSNPNRKIHICRFSNDMEQLNRILMTHNNKRLSNLPILNDNSFIPFRDDSSLTNTLSNFNSYLVDLLNFIKFQPVNSLLFNDFVNFIKFKNNDFEHYVNLNDDQILRILKPPMMSYNDEIELDLENNELENEINESFKFIQPMKIPKSHSIHSMHSKASTSTTNSNNNSLNSGTIKVKIVHNDEFSLIKLSSDDLTFEKLSNAISDKLNSINNDSINLRLTNHQFSLAYKNSNDIFVLLRDDSSLKKALSINNRKIIIKVI